MFSEAFVKLFLFLLSIVWIFYDIKTGKQETPEQDRYVIKFKNVEFTYQSEKRKVECRNKTVLIAISSAPNAINLRMAFRNEWIKNVVSFAYKFVKSSSVIYKFFVGFASNESVRQANFDESTKYNDMVISSIFDSYITLVFKTYSIFTWQQNFCPSVKYILHIQENTLISVPRLLYWIKNKFDKEYEDADGKIIFCRTMEYSDSNVKYKIKSTNQSGFEYCEDHAYLVSAKAAQLMLSQAPKETLKNSVEDFMFTGLLAEGIGAKRIHSPKHFSPTMTNCGCDINNVPHIISAKVVLIKNVTADYFFAAQQLAHMSCIDTSDESFSPLTIAHSILINNSTGQYRISSTEFHRKHDPSRNRVKKAVKHCKNCVTVPTEKILCPTETCPMVDSVSQLSLFCDGCHVTPRQSLQLIPNIVKAINNLL